MKARVPSESPAEASTDESERTFAPEEFLGAEIKHVSGSFSNLSDGASNGAIREALTRLAEFFRDGMPKDAVENPSLPMAAYAAALYTDISSWRDREYPLSSESPDTEDGR